MYSRVINKFISVLLSFSLVFTQLLFPFVAYAAIGSTLTATQTVANVVATNDQTATTATTVANVVAGTNDQTATTATTVANVVAIAQINTITVGGTVETNDTYTATLPTVGAVNYIVTAGDTTTDNIASGLNTAIQASAGYSSQAFTSSVTGSVITITAKVAGTGFTITSGATEGGVTNDQVATSAITQANVVAVAQVNTITVGGTVDTGDVYTATLPTVGAVNYTVTGGDTTTDNIATGLNNAVLASSGYSGQAFTSAVATNVITLTAKVAGTGFTQTSGSTNRAAVAQVNTITIGGTVEAGDIVTATLPTVGAVNYTVAGGDTTTSNIATGLNTAIQASAGYAGQDFTSSVVGSVITLTAKVAGTGFTQTSGTTNRTPVAQVVTFTPANVTAGETFRGTINGTDYDYLAASGNTIATVVAALATSMDAHAAVACVDTTNTTITCTASVAGTAFTYAGTVVDITNPSALTAGSVVATGGTVVASKWNSTNTGVDIIVPVANDPTLTGGTIQLQAEADATFENLGAAYTILVGDLNSNKTLSRTDTNLEGLTGFSNGDNITFRAIITDSNTNATTSSNSATSLDVDQATPTFTASRTGLNTIVLTFNEAVSASDTAISAWTLDSGTVSSVTQPSSSTTLTITTSGITNTTATPVVTYVAISGSVLDVAGNEVADGANTTATDGVSPTLAEVTPISALTNDTTPDYTFSSTEAGTITYAGGCTGNTSASAGNNTKTLNTLSDGTYGSCTIKVTDSAGNQSSLLSVSSFTVDATAPSAPSITTVATDSRVNSSEKSAIVVAGSAEANSFVTATLTDSASTVKTGTQQLTGGATSYSITIDGTTATALIDGNLAVNVTARDAANNTSAGGTAIVPLDTAAPVFSSITPVDNASIKNVTTSSSIAYTLDTAVASGSVTITRTAGTADASSPRTCSFVGTALNSGAHTLDLSDTTNSCSVAQTLVDGAVYTFVFNGTDVAGNSATAVTRTGVTYDVTSPTTAITYSPNRAVKVGEILTITATFSESMAVSPVPQISILGTNILSATDMVRTDATHYTYDFTVGSGNGTAAISISTGTDLASNAITTTPTSGETFTIDNIVPTVTSITTKDTNGDGKVETATIVFSEAVLDSNFASSDFTVGGVAVSSISSGTANDNTFDIILTSGLTGSGAKDVTYTKSSGNGSDLAGNFLANINTAGIAEVDGALPVLLSAKTNSTNTIDLTFSEDLNGTTITNSDFAVSGNTLTTPDATEVTPGVVRLTTTNTFGTGSMPQVSYTGSVNDLSSNTAATVSNMTPADGVAPILTSVALSTDNSINSAFGKIGHIVTASFTASEAIATPSVTIASQSATLTNTSGNNWIASYALTSGNSEGLIPFSIAFSDTSSNVGVTVTATTNSSTATFDKTSPTQVSTPSASVTPTNSTSQTWTWGTATDALAGISNYFYRISGSSTVASTALGDVTTFTTTLAEGIYSLFIQARDKAGNLGLESLAGSLTVDTTGPSGAVTYSTNNPVKSGATLTITATFNEPVEASPSTKIAISGSNTLTATNMTRTDSTHYTYTHTVGAGNGTSNITFSAGTDALGNSMVATPSVGATFVVDNTAPTVTKLGNDSSDVTISASGSATLSFSEVLSDNSKTAVTNGLTAKADKSLTYSWSGSNLIINASQLTTFNNDVVVNVTDLAGNSANLTLIDSKLDVTSAQTVPNESGAVTVSATKPEVVITNPTQAVTLTINSNTTNPTINVSSFITGGTGTLPAITVTSVNANNTNVAIPASTVVTSSDTSWNGVISAPTTTIVSLPETAGESKSLSTAIEVGFSGGKLTFDKAVRLLLPSQAGKRAGYIRTGIDFTEITNTCTADTQVAGDALSADTECKIDVGSDLVIWTKHFTSFAAYTQTTNSSSSSSSSSSSGSSAPVCSDTKPASAPYLLSAKSNGNNEVTLTWSKATNPVTYYLIGYGTTSGSLQFGNPNAGDANTTYYTVKGLSGGKTYYFKVRAGNNCMPGDFSNELSVAVGGAQFDGVAQGFEKDVLGETADGELKNSNVSTENVQGSSTVVSSVMANISDNKKLWVVAGIVFFGIIVGGWFFFRKPE